MINGKGANMELKAVLVERIKRPAVIDRIEIDQSEISGLADNIKEQGLLQAPILRIMGEEYEIVAGDRRILAIKLLGWTKVECVVREMADVQASEIRACENLQRVDLSVIEEARIYKNLRDKHGKKIDQIARAMGKSPGTVKRRLDLLTMPQCLQDAMHAKKISYGVAEALWPISDPGSLDYYLGFACDHGVTVTIARQWTNDWKATQRRINDSTEDGVNMLEPPAIRPTYLACDLCDQPELVENLTIVRICTECAKRLNKTKMEDL